GSGEHPKHHRHGDAGIDVTAAEINAGAGRGGDADHKVACGSGYLERNTHCLVHSQDFDGAGADAQQAGEGTRTEHESKAQRDAMDHIAAWTVRGGICAVELQDLRKTVRRGVNHLRWLRTNGKEGGVQQYDAEHNGNGSSGHVGGNQGAENGSKGSSDFKEHADADVAVAF